MRGARKANYEYIFELHTKWYCFKCSANKKWIIIMGAVLNYNINLIFKTPKEFFTSFYILHFTFFIAP